LPATESESGPEILIIEIAPPMPVQIALIVSSVFILNFRS